MIDRLKRTLSIILTLALVVPALSPAMAWATESEVEVENHTINQGQRQVSDLTIDDVDAPKPGEPLDDKAVVRAAEGDTWEIPVLWINDNLELATQAEEGATYLPALAFFVPQDLSLSGADYTVTLSESLTKLFGGREVISVYDASTGITYILPASLRYFFVPAPQEEAAVEPMVTPAYEETAPASEPQVTEERNLIDIYCSQTARDALTDEDLEWLLNLILTKLQPQAVELLLDSFPAFRAGADQGCIGTEIGLYVYYEKGDDDGYKEHSTPADALAYVAGNAYEEGDSVKYGYIVAVDTLSLVKKDSDGNPVVNERTGKYVLLRDGQAMRTFENTVVHELFHALMDDYNRTGMAGATDLRNVLTNDKDEFLSEEAGALFEKIHYPTWFIEGTASTVENDYAFRNDVFKVFRADPSIEGGFDNAAGACRRRLLENYVNGKFGDEEAYFDLTFAEGYDGDGNEVKTSNSRYVSGYLAVLYLGELAARQDQSLGSSVSTVNDRLYISSEKIRLGLNAILERMHNGETLDQVISDLSPVNEDGTKLYANTADFEAKFIKGAGVKEADGSTTYYGDNGSSASYEFVSTFLDYMFALEGQEGRQHLPNGSILFDFEEDFETPLDNQKESTSDFLHIVESNEYVESTVPNEVALAGGGKSVSGTTTNGTNAPAGDEGLAAAGSEANVVDELQADTEEPAQEEVAAQEEATVQEEVVEQEETTESIAEDVVEGEEAPVIEEASETVIEDVTVQDETPIEEVATDAADEQELLDAAA